jgi:hypothetical protein
MRPSVQQPISKDKNVMAQTRKYYLKTIIWPWGQRSRSHQGHYSTRHTALWSCTHISNIIDLSRKVKKILFKKQLFDLEVKGQGPTKVITVCDTPPYGHAPTYQISDLSRKKQLFDLEVKGQSTMKVITICDTPPYGHVPTYQLSLTYLERQKCYGPDKKILFKKQLCQRSRSHNGHYGTRHTSLWSCTHIQNIIDLSRKTKKLWSGQALLRRSGRSRRKNQTKTIHVCLPSFKGET